MEDRLRASQCLTGKYLEGMLWLVVPANAAGACLYTPDGNGHVNVPAGVNAIGSSAFSGCTSLVSINMPNVTTISRWAFSKCTSLALTSLPAGVTTIGEYAFYQCTSLALTSLPAGVTTIGDWAFYQCTSLALTSLPAGVTTIGMGTFASCTSLALTSLPAGVATIGEFAFSQCTSLALTSLPAGVTTIGQYAFQGSSSMPWLLVPPSTKVHADAFDSSTDYGLFAPPPPQSDALNRRRIDHILIGMLVVVTCALSWREALSKQQQERVAKEKIEEEERDYAL